MCLGSWDNEYGSATMAVPDFRVSRFLVTNREFLAFVRAGGYADATLWSPEGWRWVQFREAIHPTFWVCSRGCKNGCGSKLAAESHCVSPADGAAKPAAEPAAKRTAAADDDAEFRYRSVFAVSDMPWDWPVDANYLEAKAYCTWRQRLDGVVYRLPTEVRRA